MKKSLILYIITFISISAIAFSCKRKNTNEWWEGYVTRMVKEWSGKKLELPKDTIILNSPEDSRVLDLNSLKIVVYIDGTCSVCLSELSFWREFIEEVSNNGLDCKFLIYIYTKDIETMRDYLTLVNFHYPVIIDLKSQLPQKNTLFDKRFQVFLLNESNEVILIGNPTMNHDLRNTYINVIKDINKKNIEIKDHEL